MRFKRIEFRVCLYFSFIHHLYYVQMVVAVVHYEQQLELFELVEMLSNDDDDDDDDDEVFVEDLNQTEISIDEFEN